MLYHLKESVNDMKTCFEKNNKRFQEVKRRPYVSLKKGQKTALQKRRQLN